MHVATETVSEVETSSRVGILAILKVYALSIVAVGGLLALLLTT